MPSSKKTPAAKSAFDLVEEAFHLVRHLPLHDLATYYIGTLPFIASLLYFWVDMAYQNAPESRALLESFCVTVLFIWMKAWQVLYARRLWRLVAVDPAAPTPGLTGWIAMIGRQTIIHATGLVLLPLAVLVAIPFGTTYAFYQNATLLDDMSEDVNGLQRRAWKMAAAWPWQNHMLIWSLSPVLLILVFAMYFVLIPVVTAVTVDSSSLFLAVFAGLYFMAMVPLAPFALFTAINIATVLIALPHVVKMLTGAQLLFLTNYTIVLSPFFFALVCALTWCVLDPIIKAAYLLRCFYLSSLQSGEDLRAQLARVAKVLLIAAPLLFVFSSAPAFAAPEVDNVAPVQSAPAPPVVQPAVGSEQLNQALDTVMAGAEYDWRLPQQPREGGIIARFFIQVAETLKGWAKNVWGWLEDFGDWLRRVFDRGSAGGSVGGAPSMKWALYAALLVLLVALAAALILRLRSRRSGMARLVAQPIAVRPDLEDEATMADALPEEAWLRLAAELREQGNLRLALRAAFLATLTTLARCGLITVARFKSNYDYRCELDRRVHSAPHLLPLFSASARIYDAVWYGEHESTAELLQAVLQNRERLEHAPTD